MNVNFNIQQQLFDTFSTAQNDSSNVRYLKVIIEDETIILSSTVNRRHAADIDFDTILVPTLRPTEAALYIYSLKDHFLSSDGWLLLVVIPDECKVRDKMLYSSSKEYLKKQLGLQFFKHELAVNDIKDISWNYFYTNNILNRSKILSSQEILIKEEKILTSQESSSTVSKKASIGLSFDIDPQVIQALKDISNNTIVELTLIDEKISLRSTKSIANSESIKKYINDDDACYYVLQKNDLISLLLNCPETVNARKKMTLASAKSSLSSLCTEVGLKIFKTIEFSGSNEFDAAMLADATLFDVSSRAAIVKSSKPSAPGKKSSTRAKFVPEE